MKFLFEVILYFLNFVFKLFDQITVGRSTKDHNVDVDLSLEGPAWKISRRQGTIRLRNNGDFFLSSEGKRPIFVDSRPILAGNKMKLNNNSVIEVLNHSLALLYKTKYQK